MQVDFTSQYAVAEAERGKFANIDLSTLSPAYPSAGRGRYAVLTYQIGTVTANTSGTPTPTNNTIVNKSSAIDAGSLYSVPFGTTVNYLEVYNNDQRAGLPLTYVSLTNPTTFANLTATGMILNKSSFYSVSYETNTLWVGSSGIGSVDLRIIGHRTT